MTKSNGTYIHIYNQAYIVLLNFTHLMEVLAVSPPNPAEIWSFQWILVEWNLAEGPANLFIPVFSILVDSGIYTGVFPGIGRNRILLEIFICLLQQIVKQ